MAEEKGLAVDMAEFDICKQKAIVSTAFVSFPLSFMDVLSFVYLFIYLLS